MTPSPLATAPQCPPVAQSWADDGWSSLAASVAGLSTWWIAGLERRSTPLDVAADALRWWATAGVRRRPEWAHPSEIVFETPVARLRDFTHPEDADLDVVPTLVLPPQAGHDSCIVDFGPDQSQIEVIRAAGLRRVLTLDWVGATPSTKDAGINDYLAVIDRAVAHAGGRVNLIGDCQGGWLATIWAALNPEQTHSLTIAGAPIDFHAGEPVIHSYVDALSPGGDLAFYRGLVAAGGGVLRGESMLAGFILIKPDSEIEKQLGLLTHIREREHVERYRRFEDWFKYTQDIPGAFYLWIVEHLFAGNELVRGELEVAGERVDLGRIACPVNLLGGATDHITPPDQVFALAGAVSTPEDEIARGVTKGGHLGLFMSHEALREHWPPLLERVAARSHAR